MSNKNLSPLVSGGVESYIADRVRVRSFSASFEPTADSEFHSIGIDGLEVVNLVAEVEARFGVDLRAFNCSSERTPQDLIDATVAALAEKTEAAVPVFIEPVAEEEVSPAPVAPKLTLDDIKAVIVSEHYFTAGQGDARAVEDAAFSGGVLHASGRATPGDLAHVTFCVLILRNGAKVTGVNHGPVSAANFNPLVGREMARKNAVDKVFELEGYLLRERLANPASVTLNPSDEAASELAKALGSIKPGALQLVPGEHAAPKDSDSAKAAQVLEIVLDFFHSVEDRAINLDPPYAAFMDRLALAIGWEIDESQEDEQP